MKKKLMCLAMIALMVIGTPLTAYAEDYKGSKDWEVSFDGEELRSDFKSSKLTEEILNIQPGDSIKLYVTLDNDYKTKTDWYMSNEIIKTLEDTQDSAQGGAYTYVLTYIAPDGDSTVLYDSEIVGGESKSGGNEGLHEVSDSLEDFFYLDRLAHDEEARITLYVKLDGETQGNDYQKTLARIKMNFAVEKVDDEDVILTGTKYVNTMVRTGDSTNVMLFSGLAFVSGLALLTLAVVSLKKQCREKGE